MNIAFIPVRGGSKSIPLKNIELICGKPLVYWVVKAASECNQIDFVYVATDNRMIADTVKAFGMKKVRVIGRSAQSATDTATTESAMLEFANRFDFDNIALIQATSPTLKSTDLDNGFNIFNEDGVDSVISVVKQYRFNWQTDENGFVAPTNYDVYNRPRRQNFDGYYVENGAFYITSREDLLESQNRISKNIKPCVMSEDSYFEIDEPDDWKVIEAIMSKGNSNQMTDMPDIRMFLTDCDGCMTDGGMYYSENGDELKKFNTKDGMGFKILNDHKIITGIITGEDVELNRRRAKKLKLDFIESDINDKAAVFEKACNKYNVFPKNVVYVGDDINDIRALQLAGFSACPADALDEVKENVNYVCKAKGGEGVIREVVDLLLRNDKIK